MRCKIKISYSDKGKIIAKLYSSGAMVTLEWGDTIEEIIDKVSANRKKLMNNYAKDMYKTFLHLLERERNIFLNSHLFIVWLIYYNIKEI